MRERLKRHPFVQRSGAKDIAENATRSTKKRNEARMIFLVRRGTPKLKKIFYRLLKLIVFVFCYF
jgi:hypothetical protein